MVIESVILVVIIVLIFIMMAVIFTELQPQQPSEILSGFIFAVLAICGRHFNTSWLVNGIDLNTMLVITVVMIAVVWMRSILHRTGPNGNNNETVSQQETDPDACGELVINRSNQDDFILRQYLARKQQQQQWQLQQQPQQQQQQQQPTGDSEKEDYPLSEPSRNLGDVNAVSSANEWPKSKQNVQENTEPSGYSVTTPDMAQSTSNVQSIHWNVKQNGINEQQATEFRRRRRHRCRRRLESGVPNNISRRQLTGDAVEEKKDERPEHPTGSGMVSLFVPDSSDAVSTANKKPKTIKCAPENTEASRYSNKKTVLAKHGMKQNGEEDNMNDQQVTRYPDSGPASVVPNNISRTQSMSTHGFVSWRSAEQAHDEAHMNQGVGTDELEENNENNTKRNSDSEEESRYLDPGGI